MHRNFGKFEIVNVHLLPPLLDPKQGVHLLATEWMLA